MFIKSNSLFDKYIDSISFYETHQKKSEHYMLYSLIIII